LVYADDVNLLGDKIDTIKTNTQDRACSAKGEKRNAYRILMGKPDGKRSQGRTRHRCVDNIKMDLRGIRQDGVDWIDLALDRDQWRAVVNTVMNLQVP
jgi:hypothetical protein